MVFDEVAMAIFLLGGIIVTFFGVNIYRYAVLIMGACGGYMLGRIAYDALFGDKMGEGVFREANASAGRSFVIAIIVLAGIGLGYALYQITGALYAGVGGGFMFSAVMQTLMGADVISAIIGWAIGLAVGIALGIMAIFIQRWALILFTALVGARIASYTGAQFLAETSIGHTLAKPVLSMFSNFITSDMIKTALSVELFVCLAVLGFIVQLLVRND